MSATTRPARVTATRVERSRVPRQLTFPGRASGSAAQAILNAAPASLGAAARGTAPARAPLTVVAPPRFHPARTPFVALVVVLIVAGLLALLTLNTALQQASFTLSKLERQAADLADREQALAQQVAVEEAPARLAERAGQLGMVPSESPAFIRAEDGTILGVPTPAREPVAVPVAVPAADPASGPASGPAAGPVALPEPADIPVGAPELPVADTPPPSTSTEASDSAQPSTSGGATAVGEPAPATDPTAAEPATP